MRGDVANPRVTDMTNDPVASPLKQPCERPSEVGYKNPPLHSRFQPGQSGNPKGRPKGSKNVRTILREALQRRYRGREGNQEKTKAALEWLVYGSMQRAIAGKPGALRNVRDAIALAETAGLLGEEDSSDSATTRPAVETKPVARFNPLGEPPPKTMNEYEWKYLEPMNVFPLMPEELKQDYWKLDNNGRRSVWKVLRSQKRCGWSAEGAKPAWEIK